MELSQVKPNNMFHLNCPSAVRKLLWLEMWIIIPREWSRSSISIWMLKIIKSQIKTLKQQGVGVQRSLLMKLILSKLLQDRNSRLLSLNNKLLWVEAKSIDKSLSLNNLRPPLLSPSNRNQLRKSKVLKSFNNKIKSSKQIKNKRKSKKFS